MKRIVEAALIISAFTKSFLLGLFVIGYIIYFNDEYKKMKDQIEASISEDEKRPEPKIRETPSKIYPYKECVIEEYRGSIFQILKPSGELLDKIFYHLKDAKEEVDIIYPLLPKTPREKRKTYNVRRVK